MFHKFKLVIAPGPAVSWLDQVSSGTYQTKSKTAWCKLSNSFRAGEAEIKRSHYLFATTSLRRLVNAPLKHEIRFPETFGIGLLACTNSTEA
jgi:hypothetical protein